LGVDYSNPPELPLDPAEQEWANGQIREWQATNRM